MNADGAADRVYVLKRSAVRRYDGNGIFDIGEDLDQDRNLDVDEDTNGNGVLDDGEDVDGDGRLDVNEDQNDNGELDGDVWL